MCVCVCVCAPARSVDLSGLCNTRFTIAEAAGEIVFRPEEVRLARPQCVCVCARVCAQQSGLTLKSSQVCVLCPNSACVISPRDTHRRRGTGVAALICFCVHT